MGETLFEAAAVGVAEEGSDGVGVDCRRRCVGAEGVGSQHVDNSVTCISLYRQ